MLGRGPELERILAAAARARGDRGTPRIELVLIRGEAGIGKSTLAAAAVDEVAAGGFAVRVARADELAASAAGAVVGQLVGELPAPPTELEPAHAIANLATEAVDRIAAVARDGPLVLLVEDLHWADAASVVSLDRLLTSRLAAPVLVLATARLVPRTRALDMLVHRAELLGGEVLSLTPLGNGEIEELAAEAVGAKVGPNLRKQFESVGGNPLYLRELLLAFDGAGLLQRGSGTVELAADRGLPPLSVGIIGHLRSLAPGTFELLRFGAVLGGSFTASELAPLTGTPASVLVGSLDEALDAGVLVDVDGRLAFRHHVLRDALYQDLSASVRSHLHLEIARRMVERGESGGRVAQHLLRAARFDDRDVRALAVATARSLAPLDPGAAADLLAQVHAATRDRISRDELVADLALCLLWAGRSEEAEPHARDALARDLIPTVPGDVHVSLAVSLTARARARDAVEVCDAELARDRRSGPARFRLAAVRAWSLLLAADGPGAERQAEEVVAAERAGGSSPWAECLALVTLAQCHRLRGAFVVADTLIERAALAADRDPYRDAQRNNPLFVIRTSILGDLDRHDEALSVLDSDRYVPFEIGGEINLAPVWHARSLALFRLGRWDEAVAAAETGLRLWRSAGGGHSLTSSSVLTFVYVARGDLDRAAAACAEGEAEFTATRSMHNSTLLRLARARLDVALGRPAAAWSNLDEVWQVGVLLEVTVDLPSVGVELARLADAGDEPERAAFVVDQLDALRDANPGLARLAGAALLARGLVERDPDVVVAAVEQFRSGTRPVELAEAAADAAVALGRAGRKQEAQPLLDEALAGLIAVGAVLQRRAAEARARAVGLEPRRRRARSKATTGWEALSPAELEVVRLVAERLTNPEIARRLFVSPRTVQTHVSHALAKLGVSNRAELAEAAAHHAGWRYGLRDDPGGVEG